METKLNLSATQNKHFSYATVEIEHIQNTDLTTAPKWYQCNWNWECRLDYIAKLATIIHRDAESASFDGDNLNIKLLFAAVISNACLD